MDVLIVNVALPIIARDLGGGMAVRQWVVDGYSLLFAAFLTTLTLALRAVFLASAALLSLILAFELLCWRER